jgi:hypothetical protein
LSLFEICHGLECVAGKRSERAAEANHHQQAPAGIDQYPLCGPDDEEAHEKAADDVNEKRSVRKYGAELPGGDPAQEITEVGADNSGYGDGEKVFEQGNLLQMSMEFL